MTAAAATTSANVMDELDGQVLRKFWDRQALIAHDPRSVTLDRETPARVQRRIHMHQRWLFRALDAAGCQPRRVLDLGCGNGDWTMALAERATRLVAVDMTEGFTARCRDQLAARSLADRATVVRADLASYELPGPFDLIVAGAVTQYLSDADVTALFARIRNALAPNGRFYLRTTIARRAPRRTNLTASYQAIYRSIAWHRECLRDAGFVLGPHGVATSVIGSELAYRTFGENAFGRLMALPIRAFRWCYRAHQPHDVFVALAGR